jgi:hypothetical protein
LKEIPLTPSKFNSRKLMQESQAVGIAPTTNHLTSGVKDEKPKPSVRPDLTEFPPDADMLASVGQQDAGKVPFPRNPIALQVHLDDRHLVARTCGLGLDTCSQAEKRGSYY